MGLFTDSLDTIYASPIGTDGTFSAIPGQTLRVIDKTAGVDLSLGSDRDGRSSKSMPTLTPAACVRVYELATHSVTPADLVGTLVTFNDQTWKVFAVRPRPNPEGESAGETFLLLRKV